MVFEKYFLYGDFSANKWWGESKGSIIAFYSSKFVFSVIDGAIMCSDFGARGVFSRDRSGFHLYSIPVIYFMYSGSFFIVDKKSGSCFIGDLTGDLECDLEGDYGLI